MVPQFEQYFLVLEKNEVSDVFETDYGYHIVKLLDRKGDDYTCQHILIVPKFQSNAIALAAMKMDSCLQTYHGWNNYLGRSSEAILNTKD